jgi:hypothetical protein
VVAPKTDGSTEPAISAPVNTQIAPINQKVIVLGSAINKSFVISYLNLTLQKARTCLNTSEI